MTIRLVLADDHAQFRAYLADLLTRQPALSVVAQAADGRCLMQVLAQLPAAIFPHVLVVDVEMRDAGGVEATRQSLAAYPQLRVVALSMHDDPAFVAAMVDGRFPPGLELADDGVLSGTPTSAGSYAFTLKVRDASSPPLLTQQAYLLRVDPVRPRAASSAPAPALTALPRDEATKAADPFPGQPMSYKLTPASLEKLASTLPGGADTADPADTGEPQRNDERPKPAEASAPLPPSADQLKVMLGPLLDIEYPTRALFMMDLIAEMQSTRRSYHLNLVVPGYLLGDDGPYNFEELMGYVERAEPPRTSKGVERSAKTYRGTTDMTVNFMVLITDSTVRNTKLHELRASVDKTEVMQGHRRAAFLRSMVPVVLHPRGDQPRSLTPTESDRIDRDLAYIEWNFVDVGAWPVPIVTKGAGKSMHSCSCWRSRSRSQRACIPGLQGAVPGRPLPAVPVGRRAGDGTGDCVAAQLRSGFGGVAGDELPAVCGDRGVVRGGDVCDVQAEGGGAVMHERSAIS